MKSLSFFRSAVAALVLSISASAVYFSMSVLFYSHLAVLITMSAVTMGYIVYLLSNTNSNFGKLSFICLYLISNTALLIFWPYTLEHALFNTVFIWLVRTVYFHTNFFHAFIDLCFSGLSFTAAVGAVMQSHSIFISFWSFLLAQALILPVLNSLFNAKEDKPSLTTDSTELKSSKRFHQAHQNAQNAIQKLITQS